LLWGKQVDQEVLELELQGGVAAANERREKVGVGGKLKKAGKKSVLKECGIDLTAEAELGKLDPLIGRHKEVGLCLPANTYIHTHTHTHSHTHMQTHSHTHRHTHNHIHRQT
jgi:hypothetical protein